MNSVVGMLGTGNMGKALMQGFIKSEVVSKEDIIAHNRTESKLRDVENELGITSANSMDQVVSQADYVFLSAKPKDFDELLSEIAEIDIKDKIFISVAAGISIDTIKQKLGYDTKVVRLMPNTPCLVGAGIIGMADDNQINEQERGTVKALLSTSAEVIEVTEEYMDAITGLAGSGPAYAFLIMEGLASGGIKQGLSHDQSITMAAQVMMGSAQMVLETGEHPAELKDKVTSPVGTTVQALQALEDEGVSGTLMRAVEESTKKSREIKIPPRVDTVKIHNSKIIIP